MSTKSTKPYAMSHLIITMKDNANSGSHVVKVLRIAGHPYGSTTVKRAVKGLIATMATGQRIVGAVVNLISEDLSEQACKIFQPKELRDLKKAAEAFASQKRQQEA